MIEQTLAEQLRISDVEIVRRKELLKFSADDVAALVACQGLVAERVEAIVGQFYEDQGRDPEFTRLIGDADTFRRLKVTMRQYVLDLFGGDYGMHYVNARLRIGKVHERIGVPPKLYLSSTAALEDLIDANLFGDRADGQNLRAMRALRKLMNFDTQLVLDTYIAGLSAQLEAAKDEALRYADGLADKARELTELSRVDALTGLGNRRAFLDDFAREFNRARRAGGPLSLVYFDLNAFKLLNDSQGHAAGDRVLALVGSTLRSSMRGSDRGYRYGGDEFCIVMPGADLASAESAVGRLIRDFDPGSNGVSLSVGILQIDSGHDGDPGELVRAADRLMYQSKDLSRQSPGHHVTKGTWPSGNGAVIQLRAAG